MNNKSKKFKQVLIAAALIVVVAGFIKERVNQNQTLNKSAVAGKEKGKEALNSLIGKSAPSFKLVDKQGNEYTNENLKGKKVVLFFNEGLACYPACWNAMRELSNDSRFKGDDIAAFSVVTDSKESWQTATSKTSDLASIKLLFDEESKVSDDFGMTSAPSTMHSGTPGHTYVLIDKDGVIRYVLDDPKMGVDNAKVYAELSKLE